MKACNHEYIEGSIVKGFVCLLCKKKVTRKEFRKEDYAEIREDENF